MCKWCDAKTEIYAIIAKYGLDSKELRIDNELQLWYCEDEKEDQRITCYQCHCIYEFEDEKEFDEEKIREYEYKEWECWDCRDKN